MVTSSNTTSDRVVLQPYTSPPTPLRTAALNSPTPPTANNLVTVKAETAGTKITTTLSTIFGTESGSMVPKKIRMGPVFRLRVVLTQSRLTPRKAPQTGQTTNGTKPQITLNTRVFLLSGISKKLNKVIAVNACIRTPIYTGRTNSMITAPDRPSPVPSSTYVVGQFSRT